MSTLPVEEISIEPDRIAKQNLFHFFACTLIKYCPTTQYQRKRYFVSFVGAMIGARIAKRSLSHSWANIDKMLICVPHQIVENLAGVLRGLPFNSAAILSGRLWEFKERPVPLGKYWRMSPLVFSLLRHCRGECGSEK